MGEFMSNAWQVSKNTLTILRTVKGEPFEQFHHENKNNRVRHWLESIVIDIASIVDMAKWPFLVFAQTLGRQKSQLLDCFDIGGKLIIRTIGL